jgi:hypothetical protein
MLSGSGPEVLARCSLNFGASLCVLKLNTVQRAVEDGAVMITTASRQCSKREMRSDIGANAREFPSTDRGARLDQYLHRGY